MPNNLKNYLSVDCDIVSNGDIGLCHCNSCSKDEGDCDSHDECQDGNVCGENNCLASLGFDFEVDCCFPGSCLGTCYEDRWKGDDHCDDENNNCGCEWDGGDCCGDDVETTYCTECECLDPNASGLRKKENLNEKHHHGKHLRSNDHHSIVIPYAKFDRDLKQSFRNNHRLRYEGKFRRVHYSCSFLQKIFLE